MDKKLEEILVCPMCNSKLTHLVEKKLLICRFDRVAYPIDDGVPVLLPEEGKPLTGDELDNLIES
ncbi:Trm112 family protein [Aliikangiella sp. G2MR2-5]|uniref:Trm112 family protein n=1 Tax=Aliikangiella sp. G2MR2-5 TaxID=2788943 RepID=UPI0018A8C44B|nr:Trm112 family protein [Aliikangiella sp. G2MR2-5]